VVPVNTTFDLAGSTAGWSCADNAPAGTTCTINIGTVAAGAGGSVTFALQVDNPLPAGVTQVLNAAVVADDGTNGTDPTPGNNEDDEPTPTEAAPDLVVTKDDGLTIVGPGATLTYTITVQNVGNQTATGVLITDILPPLTNFVSASNGGTELSGVVTWPTFTLLAGETVTRTVTVQVFTEVPPGQTNLLNNVTVQDDGTNGTDPTPGNNEDEDEDQVVTLPNTDLVKVLVGTSEPSTLDPNVAIGEILTYQVALVIPPGNLTNMTLTDTLSRGLAFVECVSITASSANVVTSQPGGLTGVCNAATFSAVPTGSTDVVDQGRQMVLNFGTLSNSGTENAVLTVRYTVVVLDAAENVRGQQRENAVRWQWDSGDLETGADPVTIVEPDLTLLKTVEPTVVLPGGEVTFTLTVAHTAASNQDAHDVVLRDIIPPQLSYVPGSLTYVSGQPPSLLDASSPPALRVVWNTFLNNGQNSVISFRVRMGSVPAGTTVTNTATMAWTSLPGDFSDPQSDYNDLSYERFYDPASNVDIYGVSSAAQVTVPQLPETGFAPDIVTELPVQPANAYTALGDIWIEIPRLGVSAPILGVPFRDGQWDLTWLFDQVGYLEGSAYPTWKGNSALTAHVYRPDGLPGPFYALDKLAWGDIIVIHTGGQRYIYQVRSLQKVVPNNASILRHEEKPWLTLITCAGFNEKNNTYAQRLAVRAVLLRVESE